MRRARKLGTAVLALAVVLAAVYATGAFTSTSASRSADVTVAGDASAFLALETSEGPNGQFASYGSDGALQVTMGEGSRGVNPGSRTSFQNVFTISNKGAQPVSVWFAGGSKAVTFVGPNSNSIESEDRAVTLRPGGQALHVGLVIDSRGVEPGKNLLQSVEVRTESSAAGQPAGNPNRGGDEADAGGSGGKDGNSDAIGDNTATSAQNDETDGIGRRGSLNRDESSADGEGGTNGESNSGGSGDLTGAVSRELERAKGKPLAVAGEASAGALIGEAGLPDNESIGDHDLSFTAKEADSPFYALGIVLGTLVPGADILTGVRDLIANVLQGNPWGTALEVAGLVPGFGKAADVAKAVDGVSAWAKAFSGKANELLGLLKKTVLKYAPDSFERKILDVLGDGGKKGDDAGRLVTDGGKTLDKTKKAVGDGKLVDDGLSSKDYRHISNYGDADEASLAVKPTDARAGNGEVVWLEKGISDSGWKHIKGRHIEGTNNIDGKDPSSFFPIGQTIKGKGRV